MTDPTVGRKPSELPRGEVVTRLRRFYNSQPGYYRPVYVGRQLGLSTHQVAMTSRYLWTRGLVERHDITTPTGRTMSVYGLYTEGKDERVERQAG